MTTRLFFDGRCWAWEVRYPGGGQRGGWGFDSLEDAYRDWARTEAANAKAAARGLPTGLYNRGWAKQLWGR